MSLRILFISILIFMCGGCALKRTSLNAELSELHKIPLEAPQDTTRLMKERFLYLSIDYLKKNPSFKTESFSLLQKPLLRNQSAVFALEPVYADGRIQEEEMIAEARALKAHMLSLGIPSDQVIFLDSFKSETSPARKINVYLEE